MKKTPEILAAEKNMVPGVITAEGFLGDDDLSLSEIITRDECEMRALKLEFDRVADILEHIMAEGENWHVVEPREITVLDRIGGGDGFVGGLLYAILRGWEPGKWIQFGWATGALVTTLLTDYAQPADEEQIWSIWEGNARVRR